MEKCDICAKETAFLFDSGGKQLCWLCSSKQKIEAHTEGSSQEPGEERRAWKRYPVKIHMKIYYGKSEASKVIFPGTTVNISEGGMCVEWTPCEQCLGYTPGKLDPECIFSRYSSDKQDSELLYISLYLQENEVINVTAKVVFVFKKDETTEYIGMEFSDCDAYTMERIRDIIDKLD